MKRDFFIICFMSFCAALNVGIGFIVQALRLPIYLDSIGTVLAAALLGPLYGAITGVVALVVLAIITAPTALAYSGTAVVIALCSTYFTRLKYLRNWFATVLFGLLLGVIAAFVSAPVTTYLFGGVSLAGADAVTAFFKATGKTLATSVILGGLSTDPADKLITSILCHLLLAGLPARLTSRFPKFYVISK